MSFLPIDLFQQLVNASSLFDEARRHDNGDNETEATSAESDESCSEAMSLENDSYLFTQHEESPDRGTVEEQSGMGSDRMVTAFMETSSGARSLASASDSEEAEASSIARVGTGTTYFGYRGAFSNAAAFVVSQGSNSVQNNDDDDDNDDSSSVSDDNSGMQCSSGTILSSASEGNTYLHEQQQLDYFNSRPVQTSSLLPRDRASTSTTETLYTTAVPGELQSICHHINAEDDVHSEITTCSTSAQQHHNVGPADRAPPLVSDDDPSVASLSLRPSMISSSLMMTDDDDNSFSSREDDEEVRSSPPSAPATASHDMSLTEECSSGNQNMDTNGEPFNPPSQNNNYRSNTPVVIDRTSFLNVGHHLLHGADASRTRVGTSPTHATTLSLRGGGSGGGGGGREGAEAENMTGGRPQHWWSNFTESEWEEMKHIADVILTAIGDGNDDEGGGGGRSLSYSSPSLALPPLPPEPPKLNHDDRKSISNTNGASKNDSFDYSTSLWTKLVPSEFICALCNDVIVGATILDCACDKSTFCTWCVENYQSHDKEPNDENITTTKCNKETTEDDVSDDPTKELDGFVWVSKPSVERRHNINSNDQNTNVQRRPGKKAECQHGVGQQQQEEDEASKRTKHRQHQHSCPSCSKPYSRSVPCRALDVAILNTIKTLLALDDDNSNNAQHDMNRDEIHQYQNLYYQRLEKWRDEVIHRREVLLQKWDTHREIILGMLIQREEEVLWKGTTRRTRRRRYQGARRVFRYGEDGRTRWVHFLVVAAAVASFGLRVLVRK